ncbi:hypothetical protein CJF32_00005398 [Rutstroemia sp. NJR-2017a WRK4]|nr:hypothetical protein CJF32_00005398 [Rutstroemia sp. NJR-2017a WRK4]
MTLQHLHSLPRLLVLLLLITHITASPHPQLPPLLSTPITTLITLSTLNDPPPAELQTKYPSGKCAAVNKGEALCCAQQLDGQQPVVKEAAALLGYELNKNSVNGFLCFWYLVVWGSRMGKDRGLKMICAGRRGNGDKDIRNRGLMIDIQIGVRETASSACPQDHYELCCQVTLLVSFASLLISSRASIFLLRLPLVCIIGLGYLYIVVRMSELQEDIAVAGTIKAVVLHQSRVANNGRTTTADAGRLLMMDES